MDILIKPILTEKATNESEVRNTYTFLVSKNANKVEIKNCLLYTSPSPRDLSTSRMPSSA